jgi:hypothetical protein
MSYDDNEATQVLTLSQHDQRQGRFIARGYIVGGDVFVGAWRCWNQDGMTVPWEGTFIMSRVE